MTLLFMCIKQKRDLKKKYILIILVDFYVNLSQFFLLPVSDSTLPEVDPDPDPAKWYGSDRIRIQIRNTALYWLDHSFYWRAVLYWWRDLSDILMWLFFLLQGRFYTDDGTALFTDGTVLFIGIPFFFCPVCRKSCPVSKSNDPISIKNVYSVKRAVLLVKKNAIIFEEGNKSPPLLLWIFTFFAVLTYIFHINAYAWN